MRLPRQIAIEPTNRCNLKCKGCPQSHDGVGGYPVGDMSAELWEKVIGMLKGMVGKYGPIGSVAFWLNGEPLLYPGYLDRAAELDQIGIPWTITTNGMLLHEQTGKELLKFRNLYQVIFSIDGLFFDTWEKLRPGLDAKKTWENISRFLMWRNIEARKDIMVGAKIVDKGQDYEEIESFVHYYVDRFDYVIVGKALDRITDECLRKFPCRYSDDMLLEIRWDGRIIPCSYNYRAVEDCLIDLGFIQDYESITEAYNSDKFTKFRKMNYEGIFPEPCNSCGFAYCGDGFEGKVKSRYPERFGSKELYVHNDYYNTVYSLTEHRGGTSFIRPWRKDNFSEFAI